MPWHKFKKGKDYALDDVVASCRKYVNAGNVKNIKEKRLLVRIIANSGHPVIVYSPESEKGWGNSPLNPRNWRTPSGDPIYEMKS